LPKKFPDVELFTSDRKGVKMLKTAQNSPFWTPLENLYHQKLMASPFLEIFVQACAQLHPEHAQKISARTEVVYPLEFAGPRQKTALCFLGNLPDS
jgi:hypothetical protein